MAFKEKVTHYDNHALSEANSRYAISQTVAQRLNKYNGLNAEPLYHPPYAESLFFCEEPYDFIFCPGRLETLKRQELLIEAMKFIESPVSVIISGAGGQELRLRTLIERYNLEGRIRLTGRITEQQKLAYYARALAVYFAPYDEDYGYITLESMLSAKPVITALDSGGPLEFIRDGENGWIVSPDPRAIAQCIDDCYNDKPLTRDMGKFGRELYTQLDISWDKTISSLLE
ncbi:MAG: glycosyltransferase family 4 protein [Pseudomonadales bacterium]|nr:glycosyltransferase family 4 protein [Pseudomonadales bacterium]